MAESFFAKRENDRAAIRDPTKKPVIWAVLISFVHEAIGETIEVNAVEPINEYSKESWIAERTAESRKQ